MHALHSALQPTRLDGPLTLNFDGISQQLRFKLSDSAFSVVAAVDIDNKKIVLKSVQLQAGKAQLDLSGSLARDAVSAYQAQGTLKDFNPGRFINLSKLGRSQGAKSASKALQANINADFNIAGNLKPEFSSKLSFGIHDSLYDKLPMTGGGVIHMAGKRVLDSNAKLLIAGNQLSLKGAFGAPHDMLQVNIDAPALDRLGFGLAGLVKIDGEFAGTIQQPKIHAVYKAEKLKFGSQQLAQASGHIEMMGLPASNSDSALKFDLDAHGYSGEMAQLDKLTLNIAGSYDSHTIKLVSMGKVHGESIDLALTSHGRLHQAGTGLAWAGMLNQLDNRSLPRIHLASPVSISASSNQLDVGAAVITIEQAQLTLTSFAYKAGAISSTGQLDALNVTHLLRLRHEITGADMPIQTDMVLNADWNFKLAQQGSGYLQITRQGGDISIPGEAGAIKLGLDKLKMRTELQGSDLHFSAVADASRIGQLQANGNIALLASGPVLTMTPAAPVTFGSEKP